MPERLPPRRPRPLVWFWLLAPLATAALLWTSYQALAKERTTNLGRAFWLERSEVASLVSELDHAIGGLLARESAEAPELYQSYREDPSSIPGAIFEGESVDRPVAELIERPAYLPSPFFTETRTEPPASFVRLHFELAPGQASGEILSVPAAPHGRERSLALERGHATPESLARADALASELSARIGLAHIARLARDTATLPEPPLSPGANFTAFFFEGRTAQDEPAAELIALRLIDSQDGHRLQGVWYDWPRLRTALTSLAQAKLPGAEVSLAPAANRLAGGAAPPPRKNTVTTEGGRLASLALDVRVGGRKPAAAPIWTATAQSLVAAWLVVFAALFAIHHSLVRAAALSERRARFASAVTHELRTPLTTLAMYSEMLAAGLVPDEKREDYYRTLKAEADRLAALVDNVLDHAGLESGRSVQLEDLEVTAMLQGLTPRVEGCDAPLFVRAERAGLERILTNLVDNAKKYGAEPITISLTRDKGRCELRVTDAGPGIKDPAHIFDAFARGAGPGPPGKGGSSTRGLGLGLALSRDLARAMGGELTLEHPGPAAVTKGKNAATEPTPTTFLLCLPLTSQPD